ncbi:hypothetical protein A2U01_0093512, partial [Trifolium medium]|nr:hypothetical protein [Trifolium medium]
RNEEKRRTQARKSKEGLGLISRLEDGSSVDAAIEAEAMGLATAIEAKQALP